MMKLLTITLCAIFVSYAEAGVTLKLQHPRYPSKVEDTYSVKCEKDCAVEIISNDPAKGTATSEPLQTKIKELLNLYTSGFLPKEPVKQQRILYKLTASDGTKKFDLVIGNPMDYVGVEYTKFSQLINVIEEIKYAMRTEIQEKK